MPTSRSLPRSTVHSVSRPASNSSSGSTSKYSIHPVPELIELWEHDKLTDQQMVGHLLQHIADLTQRVHQLEHPASTTSGSAQPAAGAVGS